MRQPSRNILILLILLHAGFIAAVPDSVTVIGVGDIMLGTSFPDSSTLPIYPERLLLQVREIISSADLSVANLEGCLMDSGGTVKDCWDKQERCFIFRMPEAYVHYLLDAGFDALCLANNHARDMGWQGYRRTMEVCEQAGMRHAGIYDAPADTFTINGIRFGFAAFSPHWATARMHHEQDVKTIISQLDAACDVVVVMFHGGGEGAEYARTPRGNENYKGEIRGDVYRFAHTAIDAGADMVFGSGPHVTRAIELYKDRLIAYSLGNFCTYKRFNLEGSRGIAPILKVRTDGRGAFLSAQAIAIRQHYPGYPAPDPQNEAIKELQNLTHQDFPEMDSVLVIEDSGKISKR
ncbi:MAG: CapA family protein [Candidatus Marinimicrobia bacterium]|nr:CapA family protein [Candidatus Neomarinimicrobiota bacterium]